MSVHLVQYTSNNLFIVIYLCLTIFLFCMQTCLIQFGVGGVNQELEARAAQLWHDAQLFYFCFTLYSNLQLIKL